MSELLKQQISDRAEEMLDKVVRKDATGKPDIPDSLVISPSGRSLFQIMLRAIQPILSTLYDHDSANT